MSNSISTMDKTNLRSGVIMYPSHQKALEQQLDELLERTPAYFLMLTDITGQVVSARGERANISLAALGSLVAGDMAASREIARLSGAYEDCQLILREGKKLTTFICEAGDSLVLLVQVTPEIPLGWARMVIRDAAKAIDVIIATPPEAGEKMPRLDIKNMQLGDFISDALNELRKG